MINSMNANTDTSLRGPLLAAHRALRKTVDARCAVLKGESAKAALERRAGVQGWTSNEVLRPILLSHALQAALQDFGSPALIPEYSGFLDYVRAQNAKVMDGLPPPSDAKAVKESAFGDAAPVGDRARLEALGPAAIAAAIAEFADLFKETFSALLVLAQSSAETD